VFWLSWFSFTPDIRACPALKNQSQGTWNIANTNQIFNITQALKEEAWAEGVDTAGPRYFFGYIHHTHDKRSDATPRHSSISGTDTERAFLTHNAREKGMVFVSIWNDYEESIVMEPAVRVGSPSDSHADASSAGEYSFLDNFMRAALRPELRALATVHSTSSG
jgi:hypothetical protein